MDNVLQQLRGSVDRLIWVPKLARTEGLRRFGLQFARLVYVVARDVLSGGLNLRAMSLVYTTLLSIVPLLAVSFSVLKVFGVHHQVAPLLRDFFAPLGAEGVQLADDIVAFVESVQVGVLGAVGVSLLFYTAATLMYKIEMSLNFVWHIETLRSFGRRLSGFLSVMLVGPLLVFAALGITASLKSTTVVRAIARIEPFGQALQILSQLLPYFLVWVAFVFLYIFVPNIRVRFRTALIGGLIAAVLWQTAGLFFATFIASSARYAAIYSSFAIMIVTLIWLYLNWLILLVGADVCFYVQNPHYLTQMPVSLDLSNRMKESLSLGVMYLIGEHHLHRKPPHNVESLAASLALPTGPVESVLGMLHTGGFIEPTADDPPRFLPGRDLATIELSELLATVRSVGETRLLNESQVALPRPVLDSAIELRRAAERSVEQRTVRDLLSDPGEPGDSEDPADQTTATHPRRYT